MKIKTSDLTKLYHIGSSEITAINKVNFEVNATEFVAILGPSGSGKSTLLHLIGLNDLPTSGKVFIDDSDASALSSSERRKIRLLRLGFIFQTFNLLPTLSSLENVEMPMALSGRSQEEQRQRASKLLEDVGLQQRFFHKPRELSIGEMQRVGIARALANSPEAIIADEPTGELDSKTANEVIMLLCEINKEEKTTVIVATHDEKIAEAADKTYRIKDGRLTLENQH
jgi:ABC-type lipoprotein export system ATPase subunit